MPRLRRLSGDELVAIFATFGFEVVSQRGTHVKLARTIAPGHRQTITVPRHKELDTGTLRAILRQASRFVPEQDLWPHFHSD